MTENQYLIDFYNQYDEDSRLALKHGSVEFLTTMRYIEKYLRPGCRVLEVGAGTGRYSHALARCGYTVDAVELVAHNIEIFRQNMQADENVTITQGNALDLSALPILRSCLALCTTSIARRINNRLCARQSG